MVDSGTPPQSSTSSGRLVAHVGRCEQRPGLGGAAGGGDGEEDAMLRPRVQAVLLLGVGPPTPGQHLGVKVDGVALPEGQVSYDTRLLLLTVTGLALGDGRGFVLEWG